MYQVHVLLLMFTPLLNTEYSVPSVPDICSMQCSNNGSQYVAKSRARCVQKTLRMLRGQRVRSSSSFLILPNLVPSSFVHHAELFLHHCSAFFLK